jgi:hypothetical protein
MQDEPNLIELFIGTKELWKMIMKGKKINRYFKSK